MHKKHQTILNMATFLQTQMLELTKKCQQEELTTSAKQGIQTYHTVSELALQIKREIERLNRL